LRFLEEPVFEAVKLGVEQTDFVTSEATKIGI
jgi:hypothetical protein